MTNSINKFLVNTNTDWNEPPRARHQVAMALAKNNHVVFVSANRFGLPKIRIQSVSANLEVVIPKFPYDKRIRVRIPILNRLYQNWLFHKLSKIYKNYFVINFDFTATQLFHSFNKSVYYCNDDHIGLSYALNSKWIARYHELSEKKVAKDSLCCIGTSVFLVNKLKQTNKSSFEIKLGAPTIDTKEFTIVKHSHAFLNIGFVGFLNTVDRDLITFLLTKNTVHYTLIGPVEPKQLRTIKKLENCTLTGKLSGNNLYEAVRNFDVGIIPYRITSEIDRTPNKLWLYLALGIPVVISNISSIRNWKFPEKFIYLSNTNTEFYENILKAHEENTDELIIQRIAFARENSWDKRIEELLQIIHSEQSATFNQMNN